MPQDTTYTLLRYLTPPVVALTTSAGGRANGMIANSAQRASLVPSLPRLSVYVSKINFTHDLVYASGVFGLHLLRADQWDVVRALGLRSGRDADKLAGLATFRGESGIPLLTDCRAALECRVVNAMDAGAATFFLADVVGVHERAPGAPVLTSEHFRGNLPDDLRQAYEANLVVAQQKLAELAGDIDTRKSWSGAREAP